MTENPRLGAWQSGDYLTGAMPLSPTIFTNLDDTAPRVWSHMLIGWKACVKGWPLTVVVAYARFVKSGLRARKMFQLRVFAEVERSQRNVHVIGLHVPEGPIRISLAQLPVLVFSLRSCPENRLGVEIRSIMHKFVSRIVLLQSRTTPGRAASRAGSPVAGLRTDGHRGRRTWYLSLRCRFALPVSSQPP